jgi:catechol 2,3-dioxygenase-like lactoylglutathione lyase family enzyme
MLQGLWTIGIKVPDLEAELAFHRAIGNKVVLDETLTIDGQRFRIPLVKMGDKYLHLAETMVYETQLGVELPYGPTHLVYLSDAFEEDVARILAAGATAIREPAEVSAGFGDRKVAFFRSPSGWIFEVAKIYRHGVPEVC